MHILTAAAQPDYVALAMVAVLLVFVVVMTVRKYLLSKRPAPVAEKTAEVPVVASTVAPGSAGQIKIHNVEPKTVAMIMAIVAEKTGKPLNELRFISIREVEN